MITMPHALLLLEQYIYLQKGIKIKALPPKTDREIELFEKMINHVMTLQGI